MFAELYLTDGVKVVNLLGVNQTGYGIGVDRVRFARAQRETESIFANLYKTVTESYTIKIVGKNQNETIANQRALDGILVQAENYFSNDAENSLVYLVSRASDETSRRYALIFGGGTQDYGDMYDQPFAGNVGSAMIDMDLAVIRSAWLANPPNAPACKAINNAVTWQNYVPSWNSRTGTATASAGLYTVASNGNMFAGSDPNIVISTNNGASWSTSKALSAGNLAYQFTVAFGKLYAAVARPAGANTNSGIWSATLAGGSWTQEVSSANCYSFTILPDGRLLCGGDSIIRVQSASGGAWSTYSSVFNGAVKALLATSTGAVIAGDAYDVWRQPKGGAFAITQANSIGPYYSIITFNNRIALLGTYSNGTASQIDISFDDGQNFVMLKQTNAATYLYYSPTKNTVYYSEAAGVYYSIDNGLAWIFENPTGGVGSASGGLAESALGSLFAWNSNVIYEESFATVASGPLTPTNCNTPIYIGNRSTEPMLAYITVFDASPSGYTNLGGAVSTSGSNLLPSTVAVGDILYLGVIRNNLGDIRSLPNAYSFTLTANNKTTTLVYEYWNGSAWVALPELVDATQGLKRSGILSWVPAANWVPTTINSITANWIRLRVTAIGAVTTPPAASSIYAPARNYVEVTSVGGDIPALAEFRLTNANDGGDGNNWTRGSSMRIGLRSMARGATFEPYLIPNLPYNPAATGTYSVLTDWQATASGYYWQITPNINYENYAGYYLDYVGGGYNINPNSSSKDYYGTYRAFLRYSYYGTDQAITLKLQLKNIGDQVYAESEEKTLRTVVSTKGKARLLDMGQFTVGTQANLDPTEVGTNFYFNVQAKGIAPYSAQANLYELVLIPVDEWVGYFEDPGKSNINNYGGLTINTTLDIDSASYHKRQLRAMIKPGGLDTAVSMWRPSASGALMLQPGKTQRFYFLSEIWNGEYMACPYTPVYQVQLYAHERFLGGRGNG